MGFAIANFLFQTGSTVYGYGKSALNSNNILVSSRKEDILSTMLSVFEILEDTKSVE